MNPLLARLHQLDARLDQVIQLSKLDLGRKYGEIGIAGSPPKRPEKYYPTLWIDPQAKPLEMEDSGKAVVEYQVTRREIVERDGKKTYGATIEIRSIEPMCDEKKKPLEGAAKPVKFAVRSLEFSRSRNMDGEFVSQADGTPGPNAMAAAYGPSTVAKTAGAVAGLGGTATAALLLAKRMGGGKLRR